MKALAVSYGTLESRSTGMPGAPQGPRRFRQPVRMSQLLAACRCCEGEVEEYQAEDQRSRGSLGLTFRRGTLTAVAFRDRSQSPGQGSRHGVVLSSTLATSPAKGASFSGTSSTCRREPQLAFREKTPQRSRTHWTWCSTRPQGMRGLPKSSSRHCSKELLHVPYRV